MTRQIEQLPGDATQHWLDRRTELNDLMRDLVRLRRALAHISGFATFLAYRWQELNRLDYRIADCHALHRAIEHVVVPIVQRVRAHAYVDLWPDLPDRANFGDEIEQMLTHVDATFGQVFHAMRPAYLDLGQRAGKADTSEQWFFPLAGMPYLHVTTNNPATVLHESGHAIHAYRSFQAQGSLWNFCGSDEFQEFVATAMEILCWPYYDQAQGGPYTTAESTAVRQRDVHYYLEALTWMTMEDVFEHWVYGEAPDDLTPAALDAKWRELTHRYHAMGGDAGSSRR